MQAATPARRKSFLDKFLSPPKVKRAPAATDTPLQTAFYNHAAAVLEKCDRDEAAAKQQLKNIREWRQKVLATIDELLGQA